MPQNNNNWNPRLNRGGWIIVIAIFIASVCGWVFLWNKVKNNTVENNVELRIIVNNPEQLKDSNAAFLSNLKEKMDSAFLIAQKKLPENKALQIQGQTISYMSYFLATFTMVMLIIGFLGYNNIQNMRKEFKDEKDELDRIKKDFDEKIKPKYEEVENLIDDYPVDLVNKNKLLFEAYDFQEKIERNSLEKTNAEYIENELDIQETNALELIFVDTNNLIGISKKIPDDKVNKSDRLKAKHYHYRGQYLYRQGKLNKAILEFKTAIKLSSSYYEALDSVAGSYYFLGFYDESLENLDKILNNEKYKDDVRTIIHKAVVYEAMGKFEQSWECIRKASAFLQGSSSENIFFYGARGELYLREGRYETALKDFERAYYKPKYNTKVNSNKKTKTAPYRQAICHIGLEHYEEAKKLFEQCIAYYNDEEIKETFGERRKAKYLVRQSCCYLFLSVIYFKQGNSFLSKQEFAKAVNSRYNFKSISDLKRVLDRQTPNKQLLSENADCDQILETVKLLELRHCFLFYMPKEIVECLIRVLTPDDDQNSINWCINSCSESPGVGAAKISVEKIAEQLKLPTNTIEAINFIITNYTVTKKIEPEDNSFPFNEVYDKIVSGKNYFDYESNALKIEELIGKTGKEINILELCAGTGRLALLLAKKYSVTVLDKDSKMLKKLENANTAGLVIKIECKKAESFSIADATFDAIILHSGNLIFLKDEFGLFLDVPSRYEMESTFQRVKEHLKKKDGKFIVLIEKHEDTVKNMDGSTYIKLVKRNDFNRCERLHIFYDKDHPEKSYHQPVYDNVKIPYSEVKSILTSIGFGNFKTEAELEKELFFTCTLSDNPEK